MQRIKSKFDAFRQKTNIVIYGTNTVSGRLFDLVLLGVILLSVIIVMLETVKGFDIKYHHELIILEWVITVFFTLEYILRIISIQKPWKYIFSFYGIIDLIATLPMYFSLFFAGTSILTVVRALRLLRLFKILKHPQFSSQSTHLKEALIASRGKILIFIYFMLISSIIIGSVMYVIEGEEGGFTSIPISIYWTIVTLTTVGYGDISPITPLGQAIASVVMIMGYGIIAVPTGIVSAEFANSNRKKPRSERINPCNECGTEGHEFNAKYCFHCGAEL
ncbi:ion transporter [Flavobacterium glaciei]|uniref:Voltage-gated potassium channel n=1 Tax=Flavobacterium glaciei TaxID=386300 RepID=A0A562PUP5_9FLAO|nr:ion transporter [Flavobacterium glaciei]RDI56245.1 voltage-gated potassium channel [Flavobacterium glaciei]TWI48155.1 voltage-gated potassium channel [Flavobacterium glaciei]